MRLAITAAALVMASGVALAQTSPNTSNSAGSAPAPTMGQAATTPTTNSPAGTAAANPGTTPLSPAAMQPPTAGSNSFTQRQAANRLQRAGYSNVAGLKKDNKGIWHGTAQKDGSTVNVALDFKGNVSSQ